MIATDATYRVSLMEHDDQNEFQDELNKRFQVANLTFKNEDAETLISLYAKGKLHDTQIMFYLPDHIDLLSSSISYKDDGQ